MNILCSFGPPMGPPLRATSPVNQARRCGVGTVTVCKYTSRAPWVNPINITNDITICSAVLLFLSISRCDAA